MVGSIWPEGVGRGLPTGRGRSSAAGIAAGGLWVGDGGWKGVLRVRGYARELLGSLNSLPDQQRRRGRRRKGLTGEENDAGALRIVLGGGEERGGRGWCVEGGARGEPFIGGRGPGGRWSLADAGEPYSAGINAAQHRRRDSTAGAVPARTRVKGRRTERCRTSLCGEMAEGRMEATAGGDFGEGTVEGRRSN
jgi:hypothetical protein